jgi:replicative DNA helicase
MRIKNIDKVKELIKEKLPLYLKELGLRIEHTKCQCPNTDAHEHGDSQKLSAAFLPQSNNTNVYCFVEDRTFDIFDVYALKQGKQLVGENFYQAIEELAKKYDIPLEREEEFSMKEKEKRAKQKILEAVHTASKKYIKEGLEYYKKRNISKEKLVAWQIGFLTPQNLPKDVDVQFKTLYEYKLSSVFQHPALVIPVFNAHNQYVGIIMRQFGAPKGDEYLNISLNGKNLFNIHNVRGNEKVTIVEGVFDTIALFPDMNVVGCLTNQIHDSDLEALAKGKYKQIILALDPDNLYQGPARDGVLKSILRLKNFDSEIKVVEIPAEPEQANKPDPDEYMRTHKLEDFNNLPRKNALDYLIENYQQSTIKVELLYEFLAGCPNLIRKEQMITKVADTLKIGKRQLMKSIEGLSENKDSFNLIQYAQEKDSFDELLEGFTEIAWNGNYKGIPSGFPLFDQKFGGFEDTLYLMVGFPEMGKTTFLINFVYRLARNPNNFVAFYSLDDGARRAIVPRLMSIASGLTSKQIKQPTKEIEAEWFQGLKNLQALKTNLVIKDGSEIRTLPDLENFVKIHHSISQDRGKKFIVVIDNIHDLQYGGKREMETTQNSVRVAGFLKKLPQELGCPIICTAEVPKSAKEKPTGKDIKETIDFWYAARFVGGIFSDYHNTSDRTSPYVWRTPDGQFHPIMELLVSKNQTGDSFHGSLFYKFNRTNNALIECTLDEHVLLEKGQNII